MQTVKTIEIGNDDETLTKVDIHIEYTGKMVTSFLDEDYWMERFVTSIRFPADFKKEQHGMWQMEVTDQLHDLGFNTEYLDL